MRAETCTGLDALPVPANVTIARPAGIEKYLNGMPRRDIGRGKRNSAARGVLLRAEVSSAQNERGPQPPPDRVRRDQHRLWWN
jgi:hypothetical protein